MCVQIPIDNKDQLGFGRDAIGHSYDLIPSSISDASFISILVISDTNFVVLLKLIFAMFTESNDALSLFVNHCCLVNLRL